MGGNSKIKILLVDDEDGAREVLKEQLEKINYEVTDVSSGEEAVKLVEENPLRFDFALIDYVLQPCAVKEGEQERMSGADTASKISSINRNIGIIVFSGKDEGHTDALQRGVHRYIYRGISGVATVEAIKEYIKEITKLLELRENLEKFYKDRQAMGSILTRLDVGVTLIDRERYVWYVNDKLREIVGKDDLMGGLCYSLFHGYKRGICKGCIVEYALEKGETRSKFFFSPLHEGKLKYMLVMANPVRDQEGNIIAATESVTDITDSQILFEMTADEHLNIVLDAIDERGYNEGRGYKRIRVYLATGDNSLKGYRHRGDMVVMFDDTYEIPDINEHNFKGPTLESRKPTYRNREKDGIDPNDKDLGPKKDWIDFPLFNNEDKLLGWLAIDNGDGELPLDESDIDILKPYADEICKILKNKVLITKTMSEEYERMVHIEAMKLRISSTRTPEDALQIIVDDTVIVTDSDMAHIRIREDSKAVLVAYTGEYGKRALASVDITHAGSVTARVISSGRHYVVNNTKDVPFEGIFSTPKDDPIAKGVNSCVFLPLEFEREILGVMVVQSSKKNHFDDGKIAILEELAHLAALAMRDHRLKQEQEKATQAMIELMIARRMIHNIRTPAGTLRNYLTVLIRDYNNEKIEEILTEMDKQITRIETMATDVQKLLKPLSLRQKVVNINELVQSAIASLLLAYKEISSSYNFFEEPIKVNVDEESMKEVFEELISNANKAMKDKENKKICVSTRMANSEDLRKFPAVYGRGYVCIDISDSGKGVPDKIKNDIFQPWKGSDPNSPGLGLAIVKKIVEENGGAIWLAETGPSGTMFSIALPIVKE